MKIRNDFIPLSQQQEIFQFSEAKDHVDIYKLAYSSLIDLHEYLEATFLHYLDEHIVVPCKKRKCFIEEQRSNAERALNAIKNYHVNLKLKEQVVGTIERFLSDGFEEFTYAKMHYCTKLNKVLNKFFGGTMPAKEEDFIVLLVRVNFNRNGVLQHIFEFLQEQLEKIESYREQLELLAFYLKAINRVQHPSDLVYNQNLLPLKEQLIEWLDQKTYSISLKDSKAKNPIGMTSEKPLVPIKKHLVNLSVPESALLLRVFTKTNIVNIPKDDLFEYFSTFFYTKQSQDVSISSLGKKYHSPSEKNLRTVREALQKCLNHLEEIEVNLQK